MPYDEETSTVADGRKGIISSTSQNENSHVTANKFRLKVDKPSTSQEMNGHVTVSQDGQKVETPSTSQIGDGHVSANQYEQKTDTLSTSQKMNGHVATNQDGQKVETPTTSQTGDGHVTAYQYEQKTGTLSTSQKMNGHVTINQFGLKVATPSTSKIGYDHPGNSKLDQRKGTSVTRTFKSVVKRHFLKDKLFTLVSDLLGSIEEEKRAQIDLLESFHSAIETTSTVKAYAKNGFTDPIPKDSVKRVSFTPRRRRRQSDASLVDRIFESRRNSVSIAEGTIDNSVQAAKCSNDVVVGYQEIDIRDIRFGEHDRTEKRLNDYCKSGLPKCTPSPHEISNRNKNYHRAKMRPTSDSHESDKDPGFEKRHRSQSLPACRNDKLIVLLQNSFDEDKTEMDHLVLDSILKAADAVDRDTYPNTQSVEDEENECETTKEGDDIEYRPNDNPRTVNGEHERTESVDDEFYDNNEVVVETYRKDSSDISVKCTIHNENPEFENNEDKSYGRAHVVGKILTSNPYSSLNDSHEHGDNSHEDMNGESKPNNDLEDLERDQNHEPEWYAFSEKLENVCQTQNRSANTEINDTSNTYRRSSKDDVTYNNREHGHSTISGRRIEHTIAIPVESTTEESEEEEIESQIKVVGSSADSHAEFDIDSSDNDVRYDKGDFEKDYDTGDGELEFKQLNDPGGHVSTAEYTTVKRSAASLKPGLDSIAEASHESFRTMSGTPGRDTKSVIEIECKDSQKASRSKEPSTTRQRKTKSPKSRDKDCNANRVKSSRKGSSYVGFNEHSGKTNSGGNCTSGKSGRDQNVKRSKSPDKSRKLISIDLLNFYETNKDLQTIDKKRQTKPQKKAFQRKPEETTSSDSERRHHTRSPSKRRKMIRRKYDMAPLPPKTKPAPMPVLETTFLLPRAKTDLASRSSRSTSSEDTVESFKNFQVKTIENRYRKPDSVIWNKLEIRRDSNFAINNYTDRYGDGHEVVVNGGNGKTYENGYRVPLRDAIKRVKSAKTVPEYRDVPDRTPRPDRVCRIYIDLQQDRRLAGPMEYRKLDVTPRNEPEYGW
ncbi:hypothetical protein MAR_023564 [Mya arenaria]|uniref:Uncharacterized protein n=1 Tax=Mya arenaria TaxID=6604 RepID=A0ABY7DQM0_MYAAR|nr:hypothetical protein MAR_023564 [Mya arenaria]